MYTWSKGIVSWKVKTTLYISVPFTWLVGEAEEMAAKHKGKVLMGGPGLMRPTECAGFEPVVFHNPCATFTTRGCPNACSFCAVPKLEGAFRELKDFRVAPVVCDNNLLAASQAHIGRVVDRLGVLPFVDFNQGLEASRFTPWVADQLGRLKCMVRFAFDSMGEEAAVADAIALCKARTTKQIGCYVLIGFHDTPEEALYRLEKVREWGALPQPMRYQPLDAKKKNEYVDPAWDEAELKKMMRYYSRLTWTRHIPYREFQNTARGRQGLLPGIEDARGI